MLTKFKNRLQKILISKHKNQRKPTKLVGPYSSVYNCRGESNSRGGLMKLV